LHAPRHPPKTKQKKSKGKAKQPSKRKAKCPSSAKTIITQYRFILLVVSGFLSLLGGVWMVLKAV
jgi:hypothetical protein